MPNIRLPGWQIEEMFDVTQPPAFIVGDTVRRIDEEPNEEALYKVRRIYQNGSRAWMVGCVTLRGVSYNWYAARLTLVASPNPESQNPSLVKRTHKSHPTNHRIGVPKNKLP